ncbi:hypothetical protein VTI74DRAFT_1507 [Chaetomium olivicolor]
MTSSAARFPAGNALRRSSRLDRHSSSISSRQPTSWAVILTVFVCLVSHALAAAPDAGVPVKAPTIGYRSPYRHGQRWLAGPEQGLQRPKVQKRATSTSPESTATSAPSKTSASESITTTFSVAVGTPKPSSTVWTSALPTPLDSLSSSDFVSGPNGEASPCPTFIHSFLNSPTFKECYPLSMLFDKSKSFFEAQKSLVGITRTLDATCAANATSCNDYMKQLARDLIKTENCGAEYQRKLPTVVDAYNAMVAYAPIYSVGCLKDENTGAYCYANAVTNLTNPSNSYFYFLPLNMTLPGTTIPACGSCIRQTMEVYQAATADRRQMIANTYVMAAKQVNTICGPGFVNETLAAEVIPSGAGSTRLTWLATALPLATTLFWLV